MNKIVKTLLIDKELTKKLREKIVDLRISQAKIA